MNDKLVESFDIFLSLGTEFRPPIHLQGAPKDEKDILPRISNHFSDNHGSTAKRGFTISKLRRSDEGIYQCGLHTSFGTGITYRGSIMLRSKVQPRYQDRQRSSTNVKGILGNLKEPWIIGVAVFIPVLILIIGVYVTIRMRRKALQYSLASDHESLLGTGGESDEDEVHYDRRKK